VGIQRSHAIANALPVAACNRVGLECDPSGVTAGAHFWGHSFVCGPQGEWIAQAGSDRAEVLLADIDPARTERVRRMWPFLRDRRIDAYAELTRRYRDAPAPDPA
jgi:N-carbamoylputrescine amidase